jgi:hypothetical protein
MPMASKKEQDGQGIGGMLMAGAGPIIFGEESMAQAREVEWLTDDDTRLVLGWPDAVHGPWYLEPDLARVDGRTQIVGLHIRSYQRGQDRDGNPVRMPGSEGLLELTHSVVRELKMGQIAEAVRWMFAMTATAMLYMESTEPEIKEKLSRQLLEITNRGTPRKRRPAADDEQLGQIADLYRAALAQGGEAKRKPAKYVEEKLRAAGVQMDAPAVRKLIARARSRGLLEQATTPRQPG